MDTNEKRLERIATTLNASDWDGYGREFTDDLIVSAPGLETVGRGARVKWVQDLVAAFPDGRIAVRRVFGQGEWACAELTFEGTHNGPMVSASGVCRPRTGRSRFPIASSCTARAIGSRNSTSTSIRWRCSPSWA